MQGPLIHYAGAFFPDGDAFFPEEKAVLVEEKV